jgi:AcrR family transcriptional regulator
VGRRGWGGSPPKDADDARKRILDAAIRCLERQGPADTTLSDIAIEIGISRMTVYRYFASTEELFAEVAEQALGDWVARVRKVTQATGDPAEMLVEAIAYVIEELPGEVLLTLLLTSGRADRFSQRMLTPKTLARGRMILCDSRVDWEGLGYDGSALEELVEFMLRIIQSMVVAPPEQPRSPIELRRYLKRWMGPAFVPKKAI